MYSTSSTLTVWCYVSPDEEEDEGNNTNDDNNDAVVDSMEEADMDN